MTAFVCVSRPHVQPARTRVVSLGFGFMNSLNKHVLSLLCLTGGLFAQDNAQPSAASWWEGIAVVATPAAGRVENISRTSDGPTRKDATTYELAVNAGLNRQVAREWLLGVGIEANTFLEPKFDRNNRSSFGPRASLQRKFGLGPLAPILQVDVGYFHQATRYGSARGETAEAGLRVGKRLNSFLKVGAFGRWLEHAARGAVFDLTQRTAGLDATWDLADRWSLSGSVSWLDGHVVTHAAPAVWAKALAGDLGPAVAAYYKTVPREVTELYGPGWFSYITEARADLWSLALAYRVSESVAVEAHAGSTLVVNEVDVRYPVKSWGISLSSRF